MELNYQQVLAEVYEENAKNVLVHQTEYDDENQPAYEEYDYDDNDLPDKEDFNKFPGDRNKPEHVIKPPHKPDGLGLTSVKKDNIFRTNVLNIDGQFRSNQIPVNIQTNDCQGNFIPSELTLAPESVQSGTNFSFRTARQYKNVYSVEVTSIEFPNSFYTFSSDRGNTTFTITYLGNTYSLVIPDGNYTNIVNLISGTPYLPNIDPLVPDITTLTGVIQQVINIGINNFINPNDILRINYNPNIHSVYFTGTVSGNKLFTITFPYVQVNSYSNGLGYNLGFIQESYTSKLGKEPNYTVYGLGLDVQIILAETFPDSVQDRYVYLKLSDWDLITHQNPNQTSFTAFLKIPLTTPKFTIQFDNNSLNTTTKKYFFHQPTNINLIQISLLDAYGNIIDLQYSSFSLTLQIQEVLSTSTYERLLDNT
jgi:hypothetical protein